MSEPIAPPDATPAAPATAKTTRQEQAARLVEFQRSLAPYTPRVFVTWIVIAVNVGLWVAMVATGVKPMSPTVADLLRWGADYAPRTLNGQWWRAFSCMFLHAGILHLAMNMFVLLFIGRFMERLLGNGGFLVLYLFAGLTGSLLSLAHSATVVSVGASGAIFGLYGALLGFILRARGTLPKDVFQQLLRMAGAFVLYNIAFAASIAGIDQAAHVGGLVGGFAGGLVLGHPLDADGFGGRAKRSAILAALGVGLVVAVMTAMPRHVDLQAQIESFGTVEKRLIDTVNDLVKRQATNREFADTLQRDVLPEWNRQIDHMRGLAPLDRHQAKLRGRLLDYMQARGEGWQLIVDGVSHDDQSLLVKARDKQKQADELIKKIAE